LDALFSLHYAQSVSSPYIWREREVLRL
jgi:hypothetical protein